MKKFLSSAVVIVAFVFYVTFERGFFNKTNAMTVAQTPAITDQLSNSDDTTSAPPESIKPPTLTSSRPTPVATGQYKDGSYTGSAADAFYGTLQVKAIISGGKLTDVQFLQSPNDRPNSIEINKESSPILAQEAIKAQSANVDIVSGATQSSGAFKQSLTAALAQAKI